MTFPKALLIDLDGTLIDTREANFRAYAAALDSVGITLDRAQWESIGEGRNWRQFLPGLLADRPEIVPALVAARKQELYPEMLSASRVNAGLVRRLRAIRNRVGTALVTSASRGNAATVLRHHALTDLFDVIVTGCDVAQHKPAPEAFHRAATALEVRPEDCLVFEDSAVGRAAATAFGARCITIALRPAVFA